MIHRLYLTPGMFGFGKLASYDYFAHVERALAARFAAAGHDLETHVVNVAPTASIRRRAVRLAELVAATAKDDGGPIHLFGHSTGGLDARLVSSPSAHLPISAAKLGWLPRLRTVTTMSTPHFGTPLASFFATVSGQRMLYAVSALTFIGLSLGAPPLAAASALVVALGQADRALLGMEIKVFDSVTDGLMKALEPATSQTVRDYLDAIRKDQGAVIQLTPEAMDLFQAGVEDRDGVFYQSTCAMAPPPTARKLVSSLGPWSIVSSTIFTTLYGITSRFDDRYPCAAPEISAQAERLLRQTFGDFPTERANDGVVPTLSQVWGEVAWAGYADHLDVLGHFAGPTLDGGLRTRLRSVRNRLFRRADGFTTAPPADGTERIRADRPTDPDLVHVDWLRSGSGFDGRAFDGLADALAKGMLRAS